MRFEPIRVQADVYFGGLRTKRLQRTLTPMLLTNIGLTSWMVANVVAAAVFTHLASWTWLEPNLRGEGVARGGDSVVWMFGAFPVLAAAILANGVWFALASRERLRSGGVWPISSFAVVAAIWISALLVDHFRGLGF